MASTMNVLNLEKFSKCVLLTISIKRWGCRRQIKNLKALEEYLALRNAPDGEADKTAVPGVSLADDRVKSTKLLLKSKNLDALNRKLSEIKKYVQERSMPSYFQKSMMVVRQEEVRGIEDYLRKEVESVKANELTVFLDGLEADIVATETTPVKKGGLGPLFNRADYPTREMMQSQFDLDWYLLALGVPENIPDEMKQAAGEKLSRRLLDAANDIEQALRVSFKELIQHAEDRLTTEPGKTPKIFRDSMIANIRSFVDTFNSKNVFGDERLEGIIAEARIVLGGIEPQKLRDYANVRDTAKEKFTAIRDKLDAMIEEKAGRSFELED